MARVRRRKAAEAAATTRAVKKADADGLIAMTFGSDRQTVKEAIEAKGLSAEGTPARGPIDTSRSEFGF